MGYPHQDVFLLNHPASGLQASPMTRFLLVLLMVLCLPTVAFARPIPFARPVPGPIIRPISQPDQPWTPGHRGVDLAAQAEEPVRALRAGTITFAGQVNQVGWITIDHGGGLTTTYGPLAMPAVVFKGQRVAAGTVIGAIAPGESHLDLGARVPHPRWPKKHAYLNPLQLGQVWRIRLNPEGR